MWHLAPALVLFRAWIHSKFPKHVGANRKDDGAIGDPAHSSRTSDHNPNVRRSVNAIDEDEDGLHMPSVLAAAMVHSSTAYVIWERIIFKARNLFKGEAYTGPSPHDRHGHVSIWQTVKAEQNKSPWGLSAWPTLINGSTGRAVSELQALLNVYWCCDARHLTGSLAVDGHYGDATESRVRWYQERYKVAGGVDGITGTHTEYDMKTRKIARN
jgi:putative peptidoglycan binding protein